MKPGHSSLGAVVGIFYALSECNEASAQGRILANQRMNVVGEFLGTFAGIRERRELREQDPLMVSA